MGNELWEKGVYGFFPYSLIDIFPNVQERTALENEIRKSLGIV